MGHSPSNHSNNGQEAYNRWTFWRVPFLHACMQSLPSGCCRHPHLILTRYTSASMPLVCSLLDQLIAGLISTGNSLSTNTNHNQGERKAAAPVLAATSTPTDGSGASGAVLRYTESEALSIDRSRTQPLSSLAFAAQDEIEQEISSASGAPPSKGREDTVGGGSTGGSSDLRRLIHAFISRFQVRCKPAGVLGGCLLCPTPTVPPTHS